MPRRIDAYRGLAQSSRLQVMHEILERPGQSLIELSTATGLHENTLRDHVRVLETEGFIVRRTVHRPSRGRPPVVFDPVGVDHPSAVAVERIEQAKRHGDLLRRIMPEPATPSELDGDAEHQIDAVYEHLDALGLEPDFDDDPLTMRLNPCHFRSLVDERTEVVCHVHGALIQSVLEQAGGPVEVDRLMPFTTPHSCHLLMRLRRNADDGFDGDPSAVAAG